MAKSKTKIEKQTRKKTNKKLVETIRLAKKKENWKKVAEILSKPRRNSINLNLEEIEQKAKDSGTVVIPGKVLSQGDISKKIKIVALGFSGKAKEKLEKAKISSSSILEEIKKNPEAKDIEVLT